MKKILIIGAGYLQYNLIKKAKEMGFETHVFAWEEGAVGKTISDHFYPISIREKEQILKYAIRIQPAGVATIGSDLAMTTVNYIKNKLGLLTNSIECTERTSNKFLMRTILAKNGLPCPKFVGFKDTPAYDIPKLNYPVIVKPSDRSGSRGVAKVNAPSEINSAVQAALKESFNNEVIVEEFVDGREVSVEMISWKGEHFHLATTDKITSGAPFFVELEHHQPANISTNLEEELIATVKKALTVLGVEYGASHSEILITPKNTIYIVEIASRMGGDAIGSDLVKLSTGYDFVKGEIEVATGRFSGIHKSRIGFSGIFYIMAERGTVVQIVDNTSKYKNIVQKEFLVKPGDKIDVLMDSSHRSAYFIYQNESCRFKVNKNDVIKVITT